jgi:uncharacterized Rossmann fold enzyme
MDFETFEPVYEAILADFGFDRAGDERARDLLAGLLNAGDATPATPDRLDFAGQTVAVAGAADCLESEASMAADADAVVAASAAARRLRAADIDVDCMVTDLDKTPDTAVRLAEFGTPVAVHAHGDNAMAVREYVPQFRVENVLPTTQAAPTGPVYNTGGFTDGDRAAFLADHCGAAELVFPGWAFEDTSVPVQKQRKLAWAKRLLYWLERRRGDRFAVLDGHRDSLDTDALPVA